MCEKNGISGERGEGVHFVSRFWKIQRRDGGIRKIPSVGGGGGGYVYFLELHICSKLCHHAVPLAEDPLENSQSQPFPHKGYWRYKNCVLLCAKDEIPACCLALN